MTIRAITIGEAAGRSGVKVPTIRYYEEVGLLAAPGRTSGNHRHYSTDDVRRLLFIRQARELGFPIEAVRTLLQIKDRPEPSCDDAHRIARQRLDEVTHRIDSLVRLKAALEDMICGCSDGSVGSCGVIEALAEARPCSSVS